VHKVEELQHLDIVEELSQGVRARKFPNRLESHGKAQEGQILRIHRRIHTAKLWLECSSKRYEFARR
jgi:hypothetical protein